MRRNVLQRDRMLRREAQTLEAETHDATNRSDTSLRQVASSALLLRQVAFPCFVAAICRTNSNQFEFVRQIAATNSVAATMIFTCHTRWFVAATCCGDMSQRFVASCVSAFRRWLEIYLCGSYVGNRLTRGMLSLTSSLDICLLLYLVCNFLENFIHWCSVNWITPYIPDHPLLNDRNY